MRVILSVMLFMGCMSNTQENIPAISSYRLSEEPARLFRLPKKLNEISGLALSPDGKLFAHDDESARIHEIDLSSGDVLKSFSVGEKTLKGDFEGLAIAGRLFYLVSSDGTLFEFEEGRDDENVDYKKYKTKLDAKNDVEGLCYDKSSESLLLACKGDPGKGYTGYKTVYSFSLYEKKLLPEPTLKINLEIIRKSMARGFSEKLADFFQISEDTFSPSGIAIHPQRGTFFIVSARGRLLVELSRDSRINGVSLLNKKIHTQPEGIEFNTDFDLLLSDEGGNGKAGFAVYNYLPN